jgi:peptide/nickel transport system substrate-binding protein
MKNTKRITSVFFVILIISIIGIISQWQKKITHTIKIKGGSFSEGIIGAPVFINPVLAQSPSDKDVTKLVFGSIIWQDKDGNNVYDLAKHFEKIGPKHYELELKNNIFFHDGVKIDADDLIFTIEKIQNPIIKSPLQSKWEDVVVEKVNNNTVRFTLSQEYSDFIKNFSIGILPKHIWENVKDEEFILSIYNNKKAIGSGNYKIKEIKYKDSGVPKQYILEKTDYSDAYIQKINLFFYDNEIELLDAYKNGKINAAYGLSAVNISNLSKQTNNITTKFPNIIGLFFNQERQKILKDKNIRKLINITIPRKKIIKDVFLQQAYEINSPLGNKVKEDETTREELHKKIQKNGWKKNDKGIYQKKENGKVKIMSLEIATQNEKELIEIANIIKESLKKEGIQIKIRTFDKGSLHQKIIRPRNYEILLFGYAIERNTDLYSFWHSSQKNDPGINISMYENSIVDKNLELLRKEQKPELLEKIESEIIKDVPAVFIYSPAFTYILPKKIKGEKISIIEKQDRFNNIKDWYIYTRKIWNIFIKK